MVIADARRARDLALAGGAILLADKGDGAFDGIRGLCLGQQRALLAQMAQNARENFQKIRADHQLKADLLCHPFPHTFAQQRVKIGVRDLVGAEQLLIGIFKQEGECVFEFKDRLLIRIKNLW